MFLEECVFSSMSGLIARLLMLFRWFSLSRPVLQGAAILQLAYTPWQKLDTSTLPLLISAHSLSAVSVFKHHLSIVPSPPHSASLDIPSSQIHFIDFKHHPIFFTPFPAAHFFGQTIPSSWQPPHLTAAITNSVTPSFCEWQATHMIASQSSSLNTWLVLSLLLYFTLHTAFFSL